MPTARRSFVAATVAGKIQVFGGENEGGVVATVDEYEPVDNSWTTLIGNDWPNPRHGPSGGQALLGSDVTVFLTGGDTQSGANNVTPANDSFTLADVPASDPWSTAPADMGTGLLDSGHTVLGDFLYLAGGKTSPTGRVTTFLRYDMVNNAWDTLEDIPGTAREDPALVAHDGLIYIFGGATTAFNSGDAATAAVYDPDTDNWDDLGVTDLSAGRTAAAAVSWKGQIWIIGGFDSSGDTLNTVLIYSPADEEVP
jgi:N-acetylneuraminic acid mutarotase